MPKERFIADGRERLMETKEYRTTRAEVIAAVRARYAAPLASAGFFGRLVLRFRMEREIAREIEKLAPSDALYLHTQDLIGSVEGPGDLSYNKEHFKDFGQGNKANPRGDHHP